MSITSRLPGNQRCLEAAKSLGPLFRHQSTPFRESLGSLDPDFVITGNGAQLLHGNLVPAGVPRRAATQNLQSIDAAVPREQGEKLSPRTFCTLSRRDLFSF